MRIGFWNVNKKNLGNELRSLVSEYDIDILILAESEMSDAQVLRAVNPALERKLNIPFNLSARIRFYSRLPAEAITAVSDSGGLAIHSVCPPVGASFLLVAVHLPSKLYYEEIDQEMVAARFGREIEEAERSSGHDRTVVVGDFNMNPFDKGIVSADAFHATMDRAIAKRVSRVVQGQRRKFFFNPMWGRLGDSTAGPPGTYYYASSRQFSLYWNTFDQVLMRPGLLEAFSDEQLVVVTRIDGIDLLNNEGLPDSRRYSDHLPLFIELNTERLSTDGV